MKYSSFFPVLELVIIFGFTIANVHSIVFQSSYTATRQNEVYGKLIQYLDHCALVPLDLDSNNDSVSVKKDSKIDISFRLCPQGSTVSECIFTHAVRLVIKFPKGERVLGITVFALDETGVATGRFGSCDGFDETVEVPCAVKDDGDFKNTFMAYQIFPVAKPSLSGETQLFWYYDKIRPVPKKIQFSFTKVVMDENFGKTTFNYLMHQNVFGTKDKFATTDPPEPGSPETCQVAFELLPELTQDNSKSPQPTKISYEDSNSDYFFYYPSNTGEHQPISLNSKFQKEFVGVIKERLSTGANPVTNTATNDEDGLNIETFYDGCHKTKGCFGETPECTSNRNCTAFVTYSPTSDGYIRYELKADIPEGHGYVAAALSFDERMGTDIVFECSLSIPGVMSVFIGWNEDIKTNYRFLNTKCRSTTEGKISRCNITVIDGQILCNFYQSPYLIAFGNKFHTDRNAYHLLLAYGSKFDNDGIGIHERTDRWASPEPINFMHVFQKSENYDYDYRIHGSLMLFVWMVIIPNSIFIARYFKESFTSLRLCGHCIWNPVHKFLNLLAFFLTNLSMWEIVYVSYREKTKWPTSPEKKFHAIAGLICCIAMFFQVILGWGYPTSRTARKYFAGVHFVVGNIAYLSALLTIYKSYQVGLPCGTTIIIIVWILWSAFWNLIMAYHFALIDRIVPFKRKKDHMNRGFAIWPMTVKLHTEAPFGKTRLRLLLYHFLGSLVLASTLVTMYFLSDRKPHYTNNTCTGLL